MAFPGGPLPPFFYFDKLNPEYGRAKTAVLKFAYSLLGFRHSSENIEKAVLAPLERAQLVPLHQRSR